MFVDSIITRQSFNISAADATGRVRAAAQTLPREMITGPDAPALLPVLAEAVDAGLLGAQHIRTVVDTMKKVPASVPAEVRDACEQALVSTALDCDPGYLERAAALILERADPDGTLDKDAPATRMGLDFGTRNIRTGLTPLKGQLDDLGVEAVRKAIDALSAPQPTADGVADTRSPSNRRAHALVAAMRGFLDAGTGPSQGGQRPHLTVTLSWDVLTAMISGGRFDTGGYVSPAMARQLLCDAVLIPAILAQPVKCWMSAEVPGRSRRRSAAPSPSATVDAPGQAVTGRRIGATVTIFNGGAGISGRRASVMACCCVHSTIRKSIEANGGLR